MDSDSVRGRDSGSRSNIDIPYPLHSVSFAGICSAGKKKEFHDTTLKTDSGMADRTDVLGRVATPKHQRMVVPLNSLRCRLSIKTIKPLLGRTMSV